MDLFGERDDWAGTDGTYLSREEAEALLDGLEVIELVEEEHDGRSFSGPKHWHPYRVLARRPGGGSPEGRGAEDAGQSFPAAFSAR